MNKRSERGVTFRASADPRHPFEAEVDGQPWKVRLNEFPERSLYTLIVADQEVEELTEWPAAWTRPEANAKSTPPSEPPDTEDAHERAEYEREKAQFERTSKIRPSKLVK